MSAELLAALAVVAPQLSGWRRHLHMRPELSFEEHETSRWIAEQLTASGIPFTNPTGTSLVATIEGRSPGRTVALRADMDALPIEEANDVAYRSQRPGVSHACGHDGHTAMLLGAGTMLMALRGRFSGRIQLIFQSGEERPPGGAVPLIAAGILDGVDHILALHLIGGLPAGSARIRAGVAGASVDEFEAVIHGRGGHAARPHLAVDATLIAATCVVNLQTIVARRVGPLDSAVVTVGSLHAGTASNVIASEARIEGTVRALTPEVRDVLQREVERVFESTCAALAGSCTLTYRRGYPCLVNHAAEAAVLRAAAELVLGPANVAEGPPSLGGEDFAHFLEQRPGAFLLLGASDVRRGGPSANHSSTFDIDESVLPLGTRILVEGALALLSGA